MENSHNFNTAYRILGIWLILWAGVFWQSLITAVDVWVTNDTYNHCLFVVPAVLYLIWLHRGELVSIKPGFSVLGLLFLVMVLGIYSLGKSAHINVIEHIAVFAIIPGTILMTFGWKFALKIWFPLFFVFFSVPVGEELIPLFQEITADMAVFLLQLSDIPVHRNALYISVPNGEFVVAEACSGVRFFIACVVVGTAFAYLNFISRVRAFLFLMFSILVPIIANGIRAFGIIFIGQHTNMEYAVGADHLIYGWVFFAFVMVIIIGCGVKFSDGSRDWDNSSVIPNEGWSNLSVQKILSIGLLPLALGLLVNVLVAGSSPGFHLKGVSKHPSVSEEESNKVSWAPQFYDADEYFISSRVDTYGKFDTYIAVYRDNSEEKEMVSSQNRYFDPSLWSLKSSHTVELLSGTNIQVLDLTSSRGKRRLLAYWYIVPGLTTSKDITVKLQQSLNKILQKSTGGAFIAINYDYPQDQDPEVAIGRLESILNEPYTLELM